MNNIINSEWAEWPEQKIIHLCAERSTYKEMQLLAMHAMAKHLLQKFNKDTETLALWIDTLGSFVPQELANVIIKEITTYNKRNSNKNIYIEENQNNNLFNTIAEDSIRIINDVYDMEMLKKNLQNFKNTTENELKKNLKKDPKAQYKIIIIIDNFSSISSNSIGRYMAQGYSQMIEIFNVFSQMISTNSIATTVFLLGDVIKAQGSKELTPSLGTTFPYLIDFGLMLFEEKNCTQDRDNAKIIKSVVFLDRYGSRAGSQFLVNINNNKQ